MPASSLTPSIKGHLCAGAEGCVCISVSKFLVDASHWGGQQGREDREKRTGCGGGQGCGQLGLEGRGTKKEKV